MSLTHCIWAKPNGGFELTFLSVPLNCQSRWQMTRLILASFCCFGSAKNQQETPQTSLQRKFDFSKIHFLMLYCQSMSLFFFLIRIFSSQRTRIFFTKPIQGTNSFLSNSTPQMSKFLTFLPPWMLLTAQFPEVPH